MMEPTEHATDGVQIVPAFAERRENCRRYAFGGGVWIVLADSAQTAGHIANLEAVYQHGGGLPRRVHDREAEMAYVISGRLNVRIGEQPPSKALPGALVFVPAGISRRMTADADGTRVYFGFVPAGVEQLIVEHGVPTEDMIVDATSAPFDAAAAERFGIRTLSS